MWSIMVPSCHFQVIHYSHHCMCEVSRLSFIITSLTHRPSETVVSNLTLSFSEVPRLKQKIAGKSIPVEKFAVKKALRYVAQNNRLTLPAYVSVLLHLVCVRGITDIQIIVTFAYIHMSINFKLCKILNVFPSCIL